MAVPDFVRFNRLSKFRQLVQQTGVKIDDGILTAVWTNEGDDLRGNLLLKGEPSMFRGGVPATAYELVCFSKWHKGGASDVDWRKYDLVAAAGSTFKLGARTLYLCLKKDGTFVGKPKSVLRRSKTAELLANFL